MRKSRKGCCEGLAELMTPEFFKALGDPNRIALLAGLSEGPEAQNVQQVARCCDVDLSVVSRHLSQLKQAGLVTAQKKGKEVHYSLNAKAVAATLRRLADFFDSCCPPQTKKGGTTDE